MKEIFSHRSIRKFKSTPIESEKIDRMVEAATRASSTGNMQLYSIIISTERDVIDKLSPCHFNQPCVKSSPMVVTFCADINRFSHWCEISGAEPGYDNFGWFVTSAIDTTIAAQNFALEAEHLDLGICYLGTTTYNAQEIIEVLDIPKGVIPITTLVVGYPDESPELTDRLPARAVVHYQKYTNYTSDNIKGLWKEKEELETMKEFVKENGVDNLAQVFTEKRYKKADNEFFANKYLDALKQQNFIK
ncbi:MAG: nitroreductase family protein [Rikenellaceae bacterium]